MYAQFGLICPVALLRLDFYTAVSEGTLPFFDEIWWKVWVLCERTDTKRTSIRVHKIHTGHVVAFAAGNDSIFGGCIFSGYIAYMKKV